MILVVDDEPLIRDVLSDALTDEGYQVELATTGGEALTHIERQRPDLVLMDVMMPHVSGDEALRRMRADPTLIGLKVILMSAVSLPDNAAPDGFLAKPFELDTLLSCIACVLNEVD